MKATVISESGTTLDVQIRIGDLDLVKLLEPIRIEFEPLETGRVIRANICITPDILALCVKDIEVEFINEGGTIKDLDHIIESFQKLRIMMSKKEEKER